MPKRNFEEMILSLDGLLTNNTLATDEQISALQENILSIVEQFKNLSEYHVKKASFFQSCSPTMVEIYWVHISHYLSCQSIANKCKAIYDNLENLIINKPEYLPEQMQKLKSFSQKNLGKANPLTEEAVFYSDLLRSCDAIIPVLATHKELISERATLDKTPINKTSKVKLREMPLNSLTELPGFFNLGTDPKELSTLPKSKYKKLFDHENLSGKENKSANSSSASL